MLIKSFKFKLVITASVLMTVSACTSGEPVESSDVKAREGTFIETADVNPNNWPEAKNPFGAQAELEARITEIMSQMSLREKVGQVIQADIASITVDDLKVYPLGSLLNGGNSAPNEDNRSPATDWVELADQYYEASKLAYSDETRFIPMIWGTDAVHGHNNIPGATIFPHNIGLGATRNPDLLRQIGEITARETRVSGHEWTFAPTVAVVRDDRWGRTYEGYSEDPSVTASYTAELIQGIQGVPTEGNFLKDEHVIATAKHFLGDGGTQDGRDQGDNIDSEADLRDIHGAAYPIAIEAGVQAIMPSFSSWHGRKITGHKGLLTGVLKERMNFDGFLIGDWNAHGQIEGCTVTDCPEALHAGLDMYMAPDSWKGLFDSLMQQASSGELDLARLDDAVRRILRVKLRSGLFEAGKPSSRAHAGDLTVLSDKQSKHVARQAVRESLVLLKNDGILPLNPQQRVLIAGDGADNIGKQSGGWTFSWQGTGNSNDDFADGTSMYDGVKRHVETAGGQVILSQDGTYSEKPDVAIVVFGEDPYAEFVGDRESLAYKPSDESDLNILQALKANGIPTVAMFLTGRPLWVNREINASNAFVVAWLPGSEGGYAMDVIFADKEGVPVSDFKGKLSYSWPRTVVQTSLNVGDENYDPQFAFGYGLTHADDGSIASLSEEAGAVILGANLKDFLRAGRAVAPWQLSLMDNQGRKSVDTVPESSPASLLTLKAMDDGAQENILTLEQSKKGETKFSVDGRAVDMSRQLNGDMAINIKVRPEKLSEDVRLKLAVGCETRCEREFDFSKYLKAKPLGEWVNVPVLLSCFGTIEDLDQLNSPFVLKANGPYKLSLSDIHLVPNDGSKTCLPLVE
ncbi:MAG: glycoside hydrolase family 3 N-terminal domain-containing protein [Maricaulaceae bacterium]